MIDGTAMAAASEGRSYAHPVGRSAVASRRWTLVVLPTLAGLLAIGGAVADPAVDLDGEAMYRIYASEPGPLQWKALLYHFAYATWGLAALMLVSAVRRRGGWLANVAGLLAFLGISTLPGFLIVDFYDSAIGQEFGVDGTMAVERAMAPMWGLEVMALTGTVGFLLCLPVAVLAAWRAGVLRWWGALAPIAGLAIGLFLIGANVLGWAVMTAGYAVLSVGLARGTRSDDVPLNGAPPDA